MSFKNKVTEKLTVIYIRISHYMEQNKLNLYISTLEREIRDIKQQIGILCYDRWKNAQFRIEDVEEFLQSLDEKYEEIEKQKKLIQQLSSQEKQILGMIAPAVPAVLETPAGEAASDNGNDGAHMAPQRLCEKCGIVLEEGMRFCHGCGYEQLRVEETQEMDFENGGEVIRTDREKMEN